MLGTFRPSWFQENFGFKETTYDETRQRYKFNYLLCSFYFYPRSNVFLVILVFIFFIMAISRFTYDSKTKVLTIPENNKSFYVGKFELLNPADIRQRLADSPPQLKGNITLNTLEADVGNLHRNPENKNAVFQAASQVRSKKHF